MVHPQPPSPPTVQFLNSVLSQSSPLALPYAEDNKWLIRQHLVTLTESSPSLDLKIATFTHNDGRSVNLLQLDGTVPMVFKNVTYNIPVIIWLMESYPRDAPLVFVNPTRDMVIERQHSFVNPCGLVSIDYLLNWVYLSSNLVDLVHRLSHFFAIDPPLYSQCRPSVSLTPSLNPELSSSLAESVRPRTEDPGEVYRWNVIDKLVVDVFRDVEELRKKSEVEMEGMFKAQSVLRQRGEEITKGLREMHHEKEALEQQLQMVLMNIDVFEECVKVNKEELLNVVDVDEAFEPVDVLSKQMLECTAADLAIEDVVYAIDKVVQQGVIAFDVYLKRVRSLSREQFFHRATAAKVRDVQMQAQVTSMASRASASYVV
uniref:protein ELC-like n=1 Tax=Erigeron canadensis TaxID=72917 RepID=UPI001CB90756|nr:protein ELC-like [Erigeron canadensis]